jgi:conjugal transfer/type IV secretion protein DotA/TraY
MWMKLWRYVFGDFADNPFSPGGPSTLLGNMFVIFNTAIFTVGFAWAMYGVVSGVVQTAHEGEVLGKRLSTVWFPIRMITGIAGMVPMFKGFTMFQAIMMMMTAVGIGIGNSLWTAGAICLRRSARRRGIGRDRDGCGKRAERAARHPRSPPVCQ